jgi:hypothetical protein
VGLGHTLILTVPEGQFEAVTAESLEISPKAVWMKICHARRLLEKNTFLQIENFFEGSDSFLR